MNMVLHLKLETRINSEDMIREGGGKSVGDMLLFSKGRLFTRDKLESRSKKNETCISFLKSLQSRSL